MQQQAFLLRAVPVMLRPGECTPSMLAELLQASSAAGYTKLMLRLLESYPVAAQQLSAEQLERLLLQSFAWQSSGNCDGDADDEANGVQGSVAAASCVCNVCGSCHSSCSSFDSSWSSAYGGGFA
jgi:mono/diheme cytochrome c family protein